MSWMLPDPSLMPLPGGYYALADKLCKVLSASRYVETRLNGSALRI